MAFISAHAWITCSAPSWQGCHLSRCAALYQDTGYRSSPVHKTQSPFLIVLSERNIIECFPQAACICSWLCGYMRSPFTSKWQHCSCSSQDSACLQQSLMWGHIQGTCIPLMIIFINYSVCVCPESVQGSHHLETHPTQEHGSLYWCWYNGHLIESCETVNGSWWHLHIHRRTFRCGLIELGECSLHSNVHADLQTAYRGSSRTSAWASTSNWYCTWRLGRCASIP